MKNFAKHLVFSLLLILMGLCTQTAHSSEGNPTFTQRELDQMLAPIALYPDPLLTQILMASTYPLEVVEAARWSRANPGLNGDAANQAVTDQNWDPSVKSLVAFPQVLQTMDQKIDWTERLGDAFLAQRAQVMDTVQRLRQKAQEAGNLSSNTQEDVTQAGDDIEIMAANPDVVYVPYYNPALIYGSWWWPGYPPVFWVPWEGYGWNGPFAWGIGINIGTGFFFGSWNWSNHQIMIHNAGYSGSTRPWQHNPIHRHGVPYRNTLLNRQFGRAVARPASSAEFRGYETSAGIRPAESGNRLQTEHLQRTYQPQTRQATVSHNMNQPFVQPRANAFENIGRGAQVRNFSARGQASFSGRSSAPASSHGSGGYTRH